jgi:hypothetical protein
VAGLPRPGGVGGGLDGVGFPGRHGGGPFTRENFLQ